MNKQVVSFLSLFTLVVVLSIYYVMVPSSSTSLDAVAGTQGEEQEEVVSNNAPNLFFTTLEENRKARHENYKNQQIEILASSSYTNEEKVEARINLQREEDLQQTEIDLEVNLSELEFNDVFIEKIDSYFYVTAYDITYNSDDDFKKVCQIAESFTEYFTENSNNQFKSYRPQVKFITF